MISSHTTLLVRDELLGFAKSKVMVVLWIVLPALATLGFFVFPKNIPGNGGIEISMTAFMGLMLSSIAGMIAAVMIAVELVNERSRKVYELFVIRPIHPEELLWAKFLAVSICVSVACCFAVLTGILVDLARGTPITGDDMERTMWTLLSVIGVVAVSGAVGVLFGVVTKSVLVAVILVVFIGQNVAALPAIPSVLGLDAAYHSVFYVATGIITVGLLILSGVVFRAQEY